MARRARRFDRRILALAAAGVGAALAVGVTVAARRAERRNPPPGRFVEVDGVSLHYIQRGQGPDIVLLHGNGAVADDWRIAGVLDSLAEVGRVTAFDRPGFGFSGRPRGRVWTAQAQGDLLAAAIRRLGLERPIVVGHSWGTLVALALAAGGRVPLAGLVLASGYYFPQFKPMIPLLGAPGVPVLGDLLRYTISPMVTRMVLPLLLKRLFAPRPIDDRFDAEFPKDLAVRPWHLRAGGAETLLMMPAAASLRRRYRSLDLPVEVIAGAADRLIAPDRHSERLAAMLPRARLTIVPTAGHMVHYAAPEAIRAAVERIAHIEDAPTIADVEAVHAHAGHS